MVKETRIVFGLGDLVAVRFQCADCKGEVVQSMDADREMPKQWVAENDPNANKTQAALLNLRLALREARAPVTLRLELDGEEA